VTRVGVVGHVEWMDFAVVPHLPRAGEIVHATASFAEAGGGGAVAAVQLRRLAGHAAFLAALGDDALAARTREELTRRHGLELHAAVRARPQRRGWTHLDANHERTITVIGERLVPHGDDDLPWDDLAAFDAVYLTGGDPAAVRRARAARVLVATPRALDALRGSRVELDVLVASANDASERDAARALDPPPRRVVLTAGAEGGTWTGVDGATGRWAAAGLPGEPVDSYGCGDSFAAGLTFGLGAGMGLEAALELAARCGAWCLTGRGPYERQLGAEELDRAASTRPSAS
jgi:ribokinase